MSTDDYESLQCAACSHRIVDGQPFIRVEVGSGHAQKSGQQRTLLREGIPAILASVAASAAAITNGLEHALNSVPPQVREFLSSHRDTIKELGAGSASFLFSGGKQAVVFLRAHPHVGVIAATATFIVVASSGAIYVYEGLNKGRASKGRVDYLYYHAQCDECGGQSCLRSLK